ncbi:hypothetical protein K505DRAFT_143808 [Melanomma pulvis-pyrius CBS 109.77]|uniref:Uncharacterized protein n=1 Tax=Melanomma pulvis-pyrius CBS 109.77 TaxID=1314802 RepID=A0A6A6XMK4_9PLEO|nr:hypothetical protein K505DRAFT_143808 [Melanomma pulvis-pyrius CBS 109.77]
MECRAMHVARLGHAAFSSAMQTLATVCLASSHLDGVMSLVRIVPRCLFRQSRSPPPAYGKHGRLRISTTGAHGREWGLTLSSGVAQPAPPATALYRY